MRNFIPAPDAAAPDPGPPSIFFGDDGLRAGWSLLLFLTLVFLTYLASALLVNRFHLIAAPAPNTNPPLTPHTAAIGELLQFALVAIPALLMSFIERRPFTRYGLASRRVASDFFTGLAWGFLLLTLLIGLLFLTHAIAFDGLALHGALALTFALKWALIFFLVGLGEEFLFRGYLQYTLARGVAGILRMLNADAPESHRMSFWVSAIFFSVVVFMLAHLGNGGETPAGIAAVGLAGAVFAFSLYRTGSLWWGIGFHTSWDWAQSFLYGTPDSGTLAVGRLLQSHPVGSRLLSGGSDGPEGSILAIPVLLLVAFVIHLTLPPRDYPITPNQTPIPEPSPSIYTQPSA